MNALLGRLAGFLGPWLSTPALCAYTFAAGLTAGGYGVHTWYKAQRVDAIESARTTERAGVSKANQADVRYVDRIMEQRDKANANAAKWEKAFNTAADSLRHCAVGPDLLRLFNDGRSAPTAGTPGAPGPAAVEAEAGSNCAAVIATEQWNKENVVIPNSIQIEELQRFYNEQRRLFNGRRGGGWLKGSQD